MVKIKKHDGYSEIRGYIGEIEENQALVLLADNITGKWRIRKAEVLPADISAAKVMLEVQNVALRYVEMAEMEDKIEAGKEG